MRALRAVVVLLILTSLIALVGCSSTISGRVVSASTGQAIAGASVAVSGATTSTAADGSFTLGGIKREQTAGVVRVKGYPDTRFTVSAAGTLLIKVADSTLSVRVTENAVEPKAVDDYHVAIDGREVTGTAGIGLLPPGSHLVKVSSKDHEDRQIAATLTPGSNEVTASLSLTPLETYRRFYYAGQFHRDAVSYKYIHPDERKVLSLKQWQQWGAGTEDKSIKFGDVRILGKWQSPYLKKTYLNVAEVDRTTEYQVTDAKYSDFGRVYTDNFSQHWVKVDGKWFLVHAQGPK